jgi:hypothetical protein
MVKGFLFEVQCWTFPAIGGIQRSRFGLFFHVGYLKSNPPEAGKNPHSAIQNPNSI